MSEQTAAAYCPHCSRLVALRSRSGYFERHSFAGYLCPGSEQKEPPVVPLQPWRQP